MDDIAKINTAEFYNQYFYTTVDRTDALKREAYKLRYKVFIEELSFNGFNNLNKEEKDEFDEFSVQSLLFHKKTNFLVGCTRLVPFIEKFDNPLPLLKYCSKSIDLKKLEQIPYNKLGELTRVTIARQFRGRKNIPNNFLLDRRKVDNNFLMICLVISSTCLLLQNEFTHGLVFVERSVALLLKKIGVDMKEIGEEVEINGKRKPYLIDVHSTRKQFEIKYNELLSLISTEMEL